MAQFQKKTQIVEARQFEGEQPLTVVSDSNGEQTAKKGDWLVGSERGKVTVVTADKFASDYAPYSATAEDTALATAQAQVATLTSKVSDLEGQVSNLTASLAAANGENTALQQNAANASVLESQVTSLQGELTKANEATAAVQATLDKLTELERAQAAAQAAAAAAQAQVNSTIGN